MNSKNAADIRAKNIKSGNGADIRSRNINSGNGADIHVRNRILEILQIFMLET